MLLKFHALVLLWIVFHPLLQKTRVILSFYYFKATNIDLSVIEFLSAAVFIGMLVGGLVCGYASDIFGRRLCLIISLLINMLAGLACSLAPSIDILIFFRVIGGLGIGGSVPVVFSLGAEIFPYLYRGVLLSLIASFWMIGAIFASLFAWVMLGNDASGQRFLPSCTWRSYAAVCAIPATLALILTYFFVPESPRYFLHRGERSNVLKSLAVLTNGKFYDDVSKDNDDNSDSRNNQSMKAPDSQSSVFSALSLLFSPSLRTSTIVMLFIWFTLCFGSYGITTWIAVLFDDIGMSNPYFDSFLFALANLPGNVISLLFIEKLGRRRLLTWGMCLSAVAAIGFAVDTSNTAIVILCACLFNAFSVVGWNSLDCMSAELFPTCVRTSAMGLLAACGRLGAIAAQFVNGSLETNVSLLLLITGACMISGGIASWILPHDVSGQEVIEEVDECSSYSKIAVIEDETHNPVSLIKKV